MVALVTLQLAVEEALTGDQEVELVGTTDGGSGHVEAPRSTSPREAVLFR
jgi:hypothetical protein